jgi:hypothetical protein
MKQIRESQIETEFLACPYCMSDVSHYEPWRGCCSESSAHFGTAIQTYQGETYLKSEVSIIDDLKPISKGDTK